MMTKNDALAAQGSSGVRNAAVHGSIREYEIVFERAGYRFSNRCCSHFLSLPSVPAARTPLIGISRPGTGMLKADLRLQQIHYPPRRARPTGMLKLQVDASY